MPITCQAFSDYLSRKSEHLQDFLLSDITPTSGVIGMVETGRWPTEDGVSHTYDKLTRIQPNLENAWSDVTAGSCIGAPCDPDVTKIGMGFQRDSSRLKRAAFETDLICYDQVLSADRAKRQWAHIIQTLKDSTKLINDDNLLTEMFRIAGHHWCCSMTAPYLIPVTFTETGQLINVSLTDSLTSAPIVPDSKLVINMLQSRLDYQMLNGYFDKMVQGAPLEMEIFTDLQTAWELCQGDSELRDHWRFQRFEVGSKEYREYGWTARVGNCMVHALLHPLRFQITGNTLSRVFPYVNIPATVGIRGVPSNYYINAPVGATFIWHRRAMKWLTRDTTSINPMMPFAARDFAGKWQFLMDNLTCGTAVAKDSNGANITIPIPVDNSLRNKGKFHADFSGASEAQYPEYAEVFLHRREPPCFVGMPPCATAPTYVAQDFSSANEPCA